MLSWCVALCSNVNNLFGIGHESTMSYVYETVNRSQLIQADQYVSNTPALCGSTTDALSAIAGHSSSPSVRTNRSMP
jgi:hypothetical protein